MTRPAMDMRGFYLGARIVTPALRNATAKALIADRDATMLPLKPAYQKQRQTMVTQAIARATGRSFADVRQAVVEAWRKVYGCDYLFAGENSDHE